MEDAELVEYGRVVFYVVAGQEVAQQSLSLGLLLAVHLAQACLYLAAGFGGGDIVKPLALYLQGA